jgi:uncharacterized ferritin-like protein (DUF455 family)
LSIFEQAAEILKTSDAKLKAQLSCDAFKIIHEYEETKNKPLRIGSELNLTAPDVPARPEKPKLVITKEMPNHKTLGVDLSFFLLHNLAHIELNAIDMAWDTMLRFPRADLPEEFYRDFVLVAGDESRHFLMLCNRLEQLGGSYGSIPAHDGLWGSAERTKYDIKARIAIIQLVQEARGLDSWGRLVNKFVSQGDKVSAKIIDQICREEIQHVRVGMTWFKYLCEKDQVEDQAKQFQLYVRQHHGLMPPPINHEARSEAGLPRDWYESLVWSKATAKNEPKPSFKDDH